MDTLNTHHVNAYGDIWCPELKVATPDTNSGLCAACAPSAPATFTVRAIWKGDLITGDRNGLDYEDAADIYESEEKFYLNLPDSHRAAGTTLQMFRESDGHVEREVTFA